MYRIPSASVSLRVRVFYAGEERGTTSELAVRHHITRKRVRSKTRAGPVHRGRCFCAEGEGQERQMRAKGKL